MTGCHTKKVPGLPADGVSRDNCEVWCQTLMNVFIFDRDIVVGKWNRGYQREDPFNCVQDKLRYILGSSPMRIFTGQALQSKVDYAHRRLREMPSVSRQFGADSVDEEPVRACACGHIPLHISPKDDPVTALPVVNTVSRPYIAYRQAPRASCC